ncbi:hypothetical protein D6C92_10230 [Aureobasidium pullulans]|nr:hypothetical protein D6C92_10230 [Aureobasidium pullulans]
MLDQTILCSKSIYFNKALFGPFKESKTGIVKLEDVSSVLFRIFVTWIYEDKVRYTATKYSYSVEKDLEDDSDEYEDDDSEDEEQGLDEDAPFTWPRQDLVEQADTAPYERDLCFYHEHTDEEERKTCRIRREEDYDSSMDG